MSAWTSRRPQLQLLLVVAPLLIVLAWSLGAMLVSNDIAIVRAAVILSTLVIVSLFVFWIVARSDPEGQTLFLLLLTSFGLKVLAMSFRFYTNLLADAWVYDEVGEQIAATLVSGQWPQDIRYVGAGFIRLLTGLVYFATGATIYGISILWAWFGLLGMLFFYKAFSTAFPGGNRRLYMFLIFLYPSLLLWTSSLGKDALMILLLGMGAYGAARIQQRFEFVGAWWLALGLGGMLMIRPHIAAVFAVAVGFSALLRPIRAGMMTPVIRFVGVIFFAAIAFIVAQNAAGYAELESLSGEDIYGFIEEQREISTRGGSAFQQVDPRSPVGFVVATVTVLFRPFPWEANNINAVIASIEGMGLLMLVLYRWRSIWTALLRVTRDGYVALIFAYALMFVFFFSAIGNFGIIARQRAQLFPFVFMLIAQHLVARRSLTFREIGDRSVAGGRGTVEILPR